MTDPTTDEPIDHPVPPTSIEGLRSRHPSIDVAGHARRRGDAGDARRPSLVRKSQVLVARADLDRFRSAIADDYVDGVSDVSTSVVLVKLRESAGIKVGELSADMAARAGGALSVTPNHLMYACHSPGSDTDPDSRESRGDTGRVEPLGEWWGGRPQGPPVDVMEAQAGGGPPGGAQPDGEWWGGPVDQPMPIEPFGPPDAGRRDRTPIVAVLDTGIAPHPWWDNAGWFTRVAPDDLEELDLHPADQRRDSQAGHGTFVAGVVLQGSPAELIVERVLRSDGLCDEAELLKVLHRIGVWTSSSGDGRGVDVLNLSFGGYTYNDEPSPHVADAIAALAPRMAVVAAAGNHGSDRPFWPAALPDAIAVGALTADGKSIARFSNYGPWVDTYRVGVRLRSAFVSFPASPTAPVSYDGAAPNGDGGESEPAFGGYARWSGTSFAAPVVTAEIAAAIADDGLAPADAAIRARSDISGSGRAVP